MNELKPLIESLQKGTTDPLGYSIYGYDNNGNKSYNIYLPTTGLDNFYFLTYRNGVFLDANSNIVEPLNYRSTFIPTQELVEMNFKKFLNYNEFYIVEHNRLNYSRYQSPTENEADEYLNLGYEAFRVEDYEKAFYNYCRAIAEKPYDPALYRARSSVYDKRKQIPLAIDDICRAAIANPISNQNVYTLAFEDLAATYRENLNYEAAVKCYTIAIENYRRQPWNVKNRAKCFSKLGLHDKAIDEIKQLIANEKSIGLYFDLGEIYLNASQIEEAKDTFTDVINFLPKANNEIHRKMLDEMNKPIRDKARLHLQKLN